MPSPNAFKRTEFCSCLCLVVSCTNRICKKQSNNEGFDGFSSISEDILHRILSFLAAKDVHRTSLLSKTWKHAVNSYPVLEFSVSDYISEEYFPLIRDETFKKEVETFKNFVHRVDIQLLNFSKLKLSLEKFSLEIIFTDSTLVYFLDRWVGLVVQNGVKEFEFSFLHYPRNLLSYEPYFLPKTIFSATSLTILRLYRCALELEDDDSFCVKLPSLLQLSLDHVWTDDHSFTKLITSCPLIEDIFVSECFGMKEVHIFGLLKLKKLGLISLDGLKKIEIEESPCLQIIDFTSNFIDIDEEIECTILGVCNSLKSVSLEGSFVFEQSLQHLVSQCPVLETLKLHFFLTGTEKIRISSPNLKCLEVFFYWNSVDVEIDTPTLLSLTYRGTVQHFPMINAPLCRSELCFDCVYPESIINGVWHENMRQFLASLHEVVSMYLYVKTDKIQISHPSEDFSHVSLPTCAIENLVVIFVEKNPTLVFVFIEDLLVWCRPRQVNLLCGGGPDTEKLFSTIIERKDESFCKCQTKTCWRHYVKEAKLVNIEHASPLLDFPSNCALRITFIAN